MKGLLYELKSHPGKGLRLEKGGEYEGKPWYHVKVCPLHKAMKFEAPFGDGSYVTRKHERHVRCLDVEDAAIDVSLAKYTKGNAVVAYSCHGHHN